MAVLIELDDDNVEPGQQNGKPVWESPLPNRGTASGDGNPSSWEEIHQREKARDGIVAEHPDVNWNPVTEALGCYPIAMAVAAHIDLNTLDNLSRTCRAVRHGLLQYRKMLIVSTLHCCNEDVPVDKDEILRYRARAVNWFYMQEDLSSTNVSHRGKAGQCARDLVSECRRCATVVCRNCAIKPPAPIVLRDRHRRLCTACTRAPLGSLVRPKLPADVLVDSEDMQRCICKCESSEGVWLCQPCGRTIRNNDYEYKSIWRWRNQYGEVLGGVGIGIGEGDRGVICGRDAACLAATSRETETDCDAEDLREADSLSHTTSGSEAGSYGANSLPGSSSSAAGSLFAPEPEARRTPSPAMLGPGYARHEIEGIGGVVKTKLVKMVKVGACVPEWEDEKARNDIMGREAAGRVRSWCGWCWRVVPGKKDHDAVSEREREREVVERGMRLR